MTQEEIKRILENHKHWLKEDVDGWENMKANLSEADLTGADLRLANLRGADLHGADLHGANLRGADLTDVKNMHVSMACPSHCSFVGWKKAYSQDRLENRLVKLLIPEDARRSSATTNKCRCDKAQILEITDLDGKVVSGIAVSRHDHDFSYKVGEIVKVDDFCEDRFQECAAGIHFFIDRQAAIDYGR